MQFKKLVLVVVN